MKKVFTSDEMLRYWKRRLGLPLEEPGCDVMGLDDKLRDDIRIWYADLLLKAPPEYLPVENVAAECSTCYISDNAAAIYPPVRAVRLVSLKMKEWSLDEIETFSPYSETGRLQGNRLTRATVDEPVVLSRPGRLEAHGINVPDDAEIIPSGHGPQGNRGPRPEYLEMVVMPHDEYILEEALLARSELMIH